jgi:DNA-binding MarR family transcriptional regulator
VSPLLAGLADAGLIERDVIEKDRPGVALTLSPGGERAFTEAERLLSERLGSLLAQVPRPEVDALARVLPHC